MNRIAVTQSICIDAHSHSKLIQLASRVGVKDFQLAGVLIEEGLKNPMPVLKLILQRKEEAAAKELGIAAEMRIALQARGVEDGLL